MSGTPAVRARVEGRTEPPFDRLHDPIVHDLVAGGPLARRRFARSWSDRDGLARLGEAKRRALDPALARALREYHVRLGASPASLASLDRLARGEAVCAVAGQQPAPLLGPLYSLHKTATAVGLAAAFAARTGQPCVPLFWMHGEDSDFHEIRGATIFDAGLVVHDLTLPESSHVEGGLVGSIAASPLRELHAEALRRWDGLPARDAVAAALDRALARANDLGEAQSAILLALFAEQGLVVVEPRLPEFRDAARPLIARYLQHAEPLAQAVRAAGDLLEAQTGRRPLAGAALDSFVFEVRDGVRRKLAVDAARALGPGATLSPNVALRPAIQDGVLPTVAMACGAAEISYLAQLREVFEALGVEAACPVPRLGATWLPPAAIDLLEASGAHPWELVTGADAVLRRHAERAVPAVAHGALEGAREGAAAALARVAAAVESIDASLPQMVESARGKIDFQFVRLLEGVVGKVRHRLERRRPEWVRLRYALMPGERLQERRIASMQVAAYRGPAVAAETCELARAHVEVVASGRHEHLVLEL